MLDTIEKAQHVWVLRAFLFSSPEQSWPNCKTGKTAAARSMAKIKKSLANNVNYSTHTVLLWVLTLAKKGFPFFFSVYKIGLNPASIKSCQTWSTNSQDLVLSQNRWLITFSLALLMIEKYHSQMEKKSKFNSIRKHAINRDNMLTQK